MVTMKDVAAAAEVSSASVSNAYNRPSKLSTVRRNHVLRVAQELGYTGPHPSASSLRTGSVGAIGLLITDYLYYAFEDPATILLMRGIAQVSQMGGVSLTLLPGGGVVAPSEDDDPLVNGLDWPTVRRSVVDGFLVYSLPDEHPAVTSVLNRKLPAVLIDAPRIDTIPFVGIDDKAAARLAAEHLLELGHHKIGVLVDRLRPDESSGLVSQARVRRASDGVARERMRGIHEALRQAGIRISDVPVVEAGGFLFEDARYAAATLIDRFDLTAILATTDVLALTAMDVLEESGRDVPGDVSVIGFDDIPAATAAGLTTIAQPLIEKGRRAAESIIHALGGDSVGTIILPTRLVVRSSTGPTP